MTEGSQLYFRQTGKSADSYLFHPDPSVTFQEHKSSHCQHLAYVYILTFHCSIYHTFHILVLHTDGCLVDTLP